MVTVRLPAALQRFAGGAESVEVRGGTVAETLREVCSHFPALTAPLLGVGGVRWPHIALFAGGGRAPRPAEADTPLDPHDVITVLLPVAGGAHDVRMRGFRDRVPASEALAAALEGVEPLGGETVPSLGAIGRVLADPVISTVDVPAFRRATMDGYAVRSADTIGATAYAPVVLRLEGECLPGRPTRQGPGAGGAVRIMTGAPLPEAADAVLRAESATETGDSVEVRAPVAAGRNQGRVGEDVRAGSVLLQAGRRLLPADVGLLASIGSPDVVVHRRPRVRVIVSGDELLAPGEMPSGNRIVDSNSPMLAALVERDGGVAAEVLRLPDGREAMLGALADAGTDVIVTAGAASVGVEDHTPGLVAELGTLSVHGVAMRPSSPTGIGRIGGRPVFLLPGNPVSCLVAYDFFAGPAIRVLAGGSADWPYPSIRGRLSRPLASQIGRTDYFRVRLRDGLVEPMAVGGASVLSSVTGADGFVVVPSGSEGFPEGADVEVGLYGGAG